jgi:GNAT superfamily N-acetyltransferase
MALRIQLQVQYRHGLVGSASDMTATAVKTGLKAIQKLRALFLQETNFQIRYDACHGRGWTDSYLLLLDGTEVGYASIKGRDDHANRDTVFEFFVVRPFRKHARLLFRSCLTVSGAAHVECQSNEPLLTSLLHEHASDIRAEVILFEDHAVTEHVVPGVVVRPRRRADQVFEHKVEPVGEHVAVEGEEVVATGGFLLHYNMPFADLYMEVREDRRRRGIGSYLIQEVKKACYLAGRVPAARCDVTNAGSRATLTRAGLRQCGHMLCGRVTWERPGGT